MNVPKFEPKELVEGKDMIAYYVLDRVRFPNGTAYFNAKLPQKLGVVPVMVHNNCIIGISPLFGVLNSKATTEKLIDLNSIISGLLETHQSIQLG